MSYTKTEATAGNMEKNEIQAENTVTYERTFVVSVKMREKRHVLNNEILVPGCDDVVITGVGVSPFEILDSLDILAHAKEALCKQESTAENPGSLLVPFPVMPKLPRQ